VIAAAPLERGLLLMSDLPGVTVQSTLTPGQQVGTSDLLVDVDDARRVQGSIDADNEGNVYTGRVRIGGTLQVNDLLGIGDQFNGTHLRRHQRRPAVGPRVVRGHRRPGAARRGLHAHGVLAGRHLRQPVGHRRFGDVGSAFVSVPLVRSRTANVTALFDFDDKYFKDDQRTAGLAASK
jgi:hypothetical protein